MYKDEIKKIKRKIPEGNKILLLTETLKGI